MKNSYDVLIDSDVWVGQVIKNDPHHQSAMSLFDQFRKQRLNIVSTSYVIDEVVTVISHKASQQDAKDFLRTIENNALPVIFVDKQLRSSGLEIFSDTTKRGTSVVDCVNVAAMRLVQIPQIAAFDMVYHKRFELNNVMYSKRRIA